MDAEDFGAPLLSNASRKCLTLDGIRQSDLATVILYDFQQAEAVAVSLLPYFRFHDVNLRFQETGLS